MDGTQLELPVKHPRGAVYKALSEKLRRGKRLNLAFPWVCPSCRGEFKTREKLYSHRGGCR